MNCFGHCQWSAEFAPVVSRFDRFFSSCRQFCVVILFRPCIFALLTSLMIQELVAQDSMEPENLVMDDGITEKHLSESHGDTQKKLISNPISEHLVSTKPNKSHVMLLTEPSQRSVQGNLYSLDAAGVCPVITGYLNAICAINPADPSCQNPTY
jgi:hypothetical protein